MFKINNSRPSRSYNICFAQDLNYLEGDVGGMTRVTRVRCKMRKFLAILEQFAGKFLNL